MLDRTAGTLPGESCTWLALYFREPRGSVCLV